jgi:hypothetical protein
MTDSEKIMRIAEGLQKECVEITNSMRKVNPHLSLDACNLTFLYMKLAEIMVSIEDLKSESKT